MRPHRLAIGLYNDALHDGATALERTGRIELDVVGDRTSVDELIGLPQPDLLLVNDDDLAYCKVRLDERSLRTLTTGGIARLTESLPRALAWSAAWDMTRDGELAARDYVALVVAGAGKETDIGLLQSITRQSLRAVEIYTDPSWSPEGYRLLAEQALAELYAAAPGLGPPAGLGPRVPGRGPRRSTQTAIIADLLSGTHDGRRAGARRRAALGVRPGAVGPGRLRRSTGSRPSSSAIHTAAGRPARGDRAGVAARPPRPRPRPGASRSKTTRWPTRPSRRSSSDSRTRATTG